MVQKLPPQARSFRCVAKRQHAIASWDVFASAAAGTLEARCTRNVPTWAGVVTPRRECVNDLARYAISFSSSAKLRSSWTSYPFAGRIAAKQSRSIELRNEDSPLAHVEKCAERRVEVNHADDRDKAVGLLGHSHLITRVYPPLCKEFPNFADSKDFSKSAGPKQGLLFSGVGSDWPTRAVKRAHFGNKPHV